MANGYIIVRNNKSWLSQRIYKTRVKAEKNLKGIIKSNSIKQRKMTGYINMKVKVYSLNEREKLQMKKAKEFIMR